jgi:hypothetical protein
MIDIMVKMDLGKLKTKEEKMAYLRGYFVAIDTYSIWHDGERVLGCGFTTMKQEKENLDKLVESIENETI